MTDIHCTYEYFVFLGYNANVHAAESETVYFIIAIYTANKYEIACDNLFTVSYCLSFTKILH